MNGWKWNFIQAQKRVCVHACACVRTCQQRYMKSRCACVAPGVPTMMSRFSLFNARLSDSMLVPPVLRTYDMSEPQNKNS